MAMAPERTTHALQFLVGEVHALFMFCQVLAKTHHDPAMMLSQLNEAEQQGLSNLEWLPVQGDAVIEGFQYAIGGVRKAAEVEKGSQ